MQVHALQRMPLRRFRYREHRPRRNRRRTARHRHQKGRSGDADSGFSETTPTKSEFLKGWMLRKAKALQRIDTPKQARLSF